MRKGSVLAVLILFGWATFASAQEPALDLIPDDAGFALVVRNIKELKTKADKFGKEMNLRKDLDVANALTQLYDFLGFKGVVDENNAGGLMAVSTKSIGADPVAKIDDFKNLQLLVGIVPFKDRDEIGAKLGFKKGQLKEGEVAGITEGPLNNLSCFVQGKHLYVGMLPKAVKHAATAKKRLGDILTASQRKHFGEADAILQLGTVVWGKAWEEGILAQARRVLGDKMDGKEKAMGEKIVKSMEGIRFGLGGLRLEKEGLNLSLLSVWDKNNKNVQEILGLLRSGDTPTNLSGLPAENLLVAEAAKGNGVANAMLARVLFKATLQEALGTDQITTPSERAMVVGIFNEIWYHLQGNKTGLYQNTDAKKHGALTLVSILDTADGKKFYDHMGHLAKIAHGDLKPGEQGGLNVDELIKDLASKDQRKHELALLELRLLGEPALPHLKKASMISSNKDIAQQAQMLHDEIAKLAEERKKGAPAGNFFLALRPTLKVLTKTSEQEGFTVHVMKLTLPQQAQHMKKEFQQLFGPEWDEIRFAVDGKNVVVLWGSNTELYHKTLKNLKDGKAALADSKDLAGFYKHSTDARRVEMHVSATALLGLLEAGPGALPKPGTHPLSSIGLQVEPDSLQLDVWVPLGEARAMAKMFVDR